MRNTTVVTVDSKSSTSRVMCMEMMCCMCCSMMRRMDYFHAKEFRC